MRKLAPLLVAGVVAALAVAAISSARSNVSVTAKLTAKQEIPKPTFKDAGEYALHVIVNDYSGDGGAGFGCCWSTGLVKVTVK